MEPADKLLLTNNINILMTTKNVDALIDELKNRKVLTPYIVDQLDMIPTKENKTRALYDEIQSRGPAALEHLLSALAATHNEHISRALNQQIPGSNGQYFKIEVIKSQKHLDDTDGSPVSAGKIYRMRSEPRGYALIINIHRFFDPLNPFLDANEVRQGSYRDVANMYTLLDQLGYVVTMHYDLRKEEIVDRVSEFAAMPEHAAVDSTVVVVMSHGGKYDNTFKSADNQEVHCDREIVAPFKCNHLLGKPKIFIFQMCRGDARDHGIVNKPSNRSTAAGDASSSTTSPDTRAFNQPSIYDEPVDQPVDKSTSRQRGGQLDREPAINNIFQIYSTFYDHESIRDHVQGGLFVMYMCQVFAEKAHELDLMDLIKETAERLTAKYNRVYGFMTPTIMCSADCGKLFFNPGIYDGESSVATNNSCSNYNRNNVNTHNINSSRSVGESSVKKNNSSIEKTNNNNGNTCNNSFDDESSVKRNDSFIVNRNINNVDIVGNLSIVADNNATSNNGNLDTIINDNIVNLDTIINDNIVNLNNIITNTPDHNNIVMDGEFVFHTRGNRLSNKISTSNLGDEETSINNHSIVSRIMGEVTSNPNNGVDVNDGFSTSSHAQNCEETSNPNNDVDINDGFSTSSHAQKCSIINNSSSKSSGRFDPISHSTEETSNNYCKTSINSLEISGANMNSCTNSTNIQEISGANMNSCTNNTFSHVISGANMNSCTNSSNIQEISGANMNSCTNSSNIQEISGANMNSCTNSSNIQEISDANMDSCANNTHSHVISGANMNSCTNNINSHEISGANMNSFTNNNINSQEITGANMNSCRSNINSHDVVSSANMNSSTSNIYSHDVESSASQLCFKDEVDYERNSDNKVANVKNATICDQEKVVSQKNLEIVDEISVENTSITDSFETVNKIEPQSLSVIVNVDSNQTDSTSDVPCSEGQLTVKNDEQTELNDEVDCDVEKTNLGLRKTKQKRSQGNDESDDDKTTKCFDKNMCVLY